MRETGAIADSHTHLKSENSRKYSVYPQNGILYGNIPPIYLIRDVIQKQFDELIVVLMGIKCYLLGTLNPLPVIPTISLEPTPYRHRLRPKESIQVRLAAHWRLC